MKTSDINVHKQLDGNYTIGPAENTVFISNTGIRCKRAVDIKEYELANWSEEAHENN